MATWHGRFEEIVHETEGLESPDIVRRKALYEVMVSQLIDEANDLHRKTEIRGVQYHYTPIYTLGSVEAVEFIPGGMVDFNEDI